MLPFDVLLEPSAILKLPATREIVRRLSDMRGYFADSSAYDAALAREDRVVYRFWEVEYHGDARGLSFGVTTIYPGDVGGEFHMTKGHFHANGGDEIYLTLKGEGRLLLQSRAGEATAVVMRPGSLAYIPGEWGHRTLNVTGEDFVFMGIWPPGIEHDYQSVQAHGFPQLCVSGPQGPQLIDNPTFRLSLADSAGR